MNFEAMNFIENLHYMGEGMGCILIVMAALIGVTALLNKITSRKSDD
jgi:hypothetical protein